SAPFSAALCAAPSPYTTLFRSVREARALQQRLGRGDHVTLHAVVRARNDDAIPYETLVATIPGTDATAGEIVFSCHLDHEKPGADRKSTRLNSSHQIISYAVFC